MKHQLKWVTYRGIGDQNTTTLLDEIYSSRSTDKDGEREIKDPDVLAMREDFMALRNLGREQREAYNGATDAEKKETLPERPGSPRPTPRKYDVDGMSDRELDRISVWLETNNKDPDEEETTKEAKEEAAIEEKKKFDEYKHHQFVKRWGLLYESNGKDEEWFIPSPPALEPTDPEYLCDMCRQIDFNTLLTQRGLPGNQKAGPTTIQLYGFSKIMKEQHCSFCTLLREALVAERPSEQLPAPEDLRDLSKTISLNVVDEGPEYALRLEVELGTIANEKYPRVIVQKMAENDALPLQGLPVCQDAADMGRLRGWVKACEEGHCGTESSNVPKRSHITGRSTLRVIDTEKNCVVSVDLPCSYTCLSYVWGAGAQTLLTASTREVLETPGGLTHPSINLHQTIKDAVKTTRDIGLRYIWIDALCILQDDAADKAAIISQMGNIYGNSTLTIVASTNVEPRDGLPGIGRTARSRRQIVQQVQGVFLAATFHDSRRPHREILDSVWNSRAWTFQERHLPPRSVYFTTSQMLFTCPHGTAYEDTVPVQDPAYKPSPLNDQTRLTARLHDLHYRIWSDVTQSRYPNKVIAAQGDSSTMVMIAEDPENPGERNPAGAPTYRYCAEPDAEQEGALAIQGQSLWRTYSSAVDLYTQRNMTWQTDALNAFSGVSDLISQGVNTKFWFGLPEFSFDQALLWRPRCALRRRTEMPSIPSWSWAAWQGHSSYRGRGWHNAIAVPPAPIIMWLRDVSKTDSPDDPTKLTLSVINPYSLWKIRDEYEDLNGWVMIPDKKRNEHLYEHPEYPGLKFTMPICLPSEEVIERPAEDGKLYFLGRMAPVVFTEFNSLSTTWNNQKHRAVMQIGVGDEHMSANYRPEWQRILYNHQGYRAGFLFLNSDFDEKEEDERKNKQYALVAMSQDSLSHVAPPLMGWELYWQGEPRIMHAGVQRMVRRMWAEQDKEDEQNGQEDEEEADGEAIDWDKKPHENENGDPHWDEERFGEAGGFLNVYNVLLLVRRTDTENGREAWRRAGVGKVNTKAFMETRVKENLVILR